MPGTYPESVAFQWMVELARGIVGNSLFVYLPYLPWVLTESAAELALASFELVPYLFPPVGLAQPSLGIALPELDPPAKYLSRIPPVVSKAWRKDGAVLVLLCNMRNQPLTLNVTATVPGARFAGGSGFMPLANHRAVPLNPDGSFQATMSPFDTQVILFNTSKPSDGLEEDEATNAVFNPGMERFALPGHALGWSIAGNGASSSGNASAFAYSETRFARRGTHCLRLTTPFDTFAQTRVPLPINNSRLQRGLASYTVKVYARAYDIRAPRSLHLVSGGTTVATLPLTRAWAKLEAQVQLNSSQEVELALVAGGPGTLYIDAEWGARFGAALAADESPQ